MPLERISAEEVRARPGSIQELAVRLTDDDGSPVAKKSVTFTVTPPGAVLFNGAQYAAVDTDAHGIVSVRALINVVGRHVVHVKAPPADRQHKVQFTAIGTSDTEVMPMGDDILVINGGGEQPTHIPMWPIAAMVIAAMVIGGALWLFGGRSGSSAPAPTPVVIHQGGGGGSTVDHTARADAAAARASVEAAKQELGLALDTGLAENAAHDQGYAREYTRPTLRQALATARQVREHLTGRRGDQKPAICDDDPNLPACRE